MRSLPTSLLLSLSLAAIPATLSAQGWADLFRQAQKQAKESLDQAQQQLEEAGAQLEAQGESSAPAAPSGGFNFGGVQLQGGQDANGNYRGGLNFQGMKLGFGMGKDGVQGSVEAGGAKVEGTVDGQGVRGDVQAGGSRVQGSVNGQGVQGNVLAGDGTQVQGVVDGQGPRGSINPSQALWGKAMSKGQALAKKAAGPFESSLDGYFQGLRTYQEQGMDTQKDLAALKALVPEARQLDKVFSKIQSAASAGASPAPATVELYQKLQGAFQPKMMKFSQRLAALALQHQSQMMQQYMGTLGK